MYFMSGIIYLFMYFMSGKMLRSFQWRVNRQVMKVLVHLRICARPGMWVVSLLDLHTKLCFCMCITVKRRQYKCYTLLQHTAFINSVSDSDINIHATVKFPRHFP
jgi:hypothetical protein